MRDYGKVYTAFWTSEDARGFSEDGRLLSLYLMTCPHGNMLGCFRLPDAYAAEDLKWPIERVSKGFEELYQKGFSYRCDRSFWLFLRQYLKWNQFDNPNVGKAAGKLFDSISPPHTVKALLVKALREFSATFPEKKLNDFETLSIPFENPFELISKTVVVAVPVVVATAVAESVATAEAGKPKNEKTSAVTPVQISIAMRAGGIQSQPANPVIIALAEQGVTVDVVAAACEHAKISKPGEVIGLNYVVAIINRWAKDAAEIKASGARPPSTKPEKFDPSAYVNQKGIMRNERPFERTIEFDEHGQPL